LKNVGVTGLFDIGTTHMHTHTHTHTLKLKTSSFVCQGPTKKGG